MPAVSPRWVLNSLLYILLTGCRWCDLPKGPQGASKSSAHRWLRTWQQNGTLEKIKQRVLGLAHNEGLIRWERLPHCFDAFLFLAIIGVTQLKRETVKNQPVVGAVREPPAPEHGPFSYRTA
jgi:hypothetical protein